MESDDYLRLQEATMLRATAISDKVKRGEMSAEAGDAAMVSMVKDLEQARGAVAAASRRKARLRLVTFCAALALLGVAVAILRWVA
jgi:hypothetical protein